MIEYLINVHVPFFFFFKVVVTLSSNCGVIPLMLGSCKKVRYLICGTG